MLKHILTVFFLFFGVFCYSKQELPPFNDNESTRSNIALIYAGIGHANVLIGEYNLALEEFNRATYLSNKLDKREPVLEFWISFGKAVAYDNLWNREECERAIGSLILTIFEFDEEGSEEEFYADIIDDQTLTQCQIMIEMMRKMASSTPSLDVRNVLLTIVEAVEEEIVEIFEISDLDSSEDI